MFWPVQPVPHVVLEVQVAQQLQKMLPDNPITPDAIQFLIQHACYRRTKRLLKEVDLPLRVFVAG